MFADLFACLECASYFDGNSHDELSVTIMPDNIGYDPVETSACIGLHGAYYTVVY